MAFDVQAMSPPENTDEISQWVMSQVDAVLHDAIAVPIEQLISALAPIIVIALSIQFLVYAMALMRGHGDMSVTEFFWKSVRIAIIASFATAGGIYQTSIADLMVSLPDEAAGIISTNHTITERIDELREMTQEATSDMQQGDSGGFFLDLKGTVLSLYAGYLSALTAIISAGLAVLLVVVKVGMALVVATGPFFITALAFEPTKRLFDNWVSQALNFIFLAVLVGLVFSFLLQMNLMYMSMFISQLGTGDNEVLALLGGYSLTVIASIVVLFFIPGLAQGLSGGFGAQLGVGIAGRSAFTTLHATSLARRLMSRPR